MKKFLCLILFVVLTYPARSQWILQGLGYELPYIVTDKIDVVDQNIVWTANNYNGAPPPTRYFSRTADGGQNWYAGSIQSYESYRIWCISAIDFQTAWFCLASVSFLPFKLLKTQDGGQSWQQQFPFGSNDTIINGIVHFWNANEGCYFQWRQGKSFRASTTSDGGNTWNIVDSADIPLPLFYGSMSSEGTYGQNATGDMIYMSTQFGRIIKSIDKGHHWTALSTPWTTYSYVNTFFAEFQNMNHGLIKNSSFNLYETFNAGNTWLPITNNPPVQDGLCWVPQTLNTCASFKGYSFDGGHTWTAWDTMPGLSSMAWANNTNGWVGYGTVMPIPANTGIYKYNGLLVDILKIDPGQGGFKIYPNPTGGKIKLVIVGFRGEEFQFELFNLTGQMLFSQTFNQDLIQSERSFDLSFLSQGAYLASIRCGTKSFTEKVIIER